MRTKKWLAVLMAVVMAASLLPTAAFAAGPTDSVVNRVENTESWYADTTASFAKLEDYWFEQVKAAPADYQADAEAKTVSIGSPQALVWWAKQVNEGVSFAGYTVNITADIDLSAYYWTPICTGAVSVSGGQYTVTARDVLEGTVINGGGHKITGLTTATGLRGPNEGSVPGDGQNCYYYSAFIGYNSGNLTVKELTFDQASIAICEPVEVTKENGSSTIAVVVGAQSQGQLTLNRVAVTNSQVLAMQKAGAFVGNFLGGGKASIEKCQVSDSTFSAFFMVSPINGYAATSQVEIQGIKLSGNTVNVVEQASQTYSVNPETGAEYWAGYLNATTTAMFYDGTTAYGKGTELTFAAQLDGFLYTDAADAKHSLTQVPAKDATCTEAGNKACWVCRDCGKYFADAAGAQELTEAEVVIPAAGHKFEDGVCTVCGAKVTVDVEEQPTVDPTKPSDSVQVGLDPEKNTVDLGQELNTVVEDVLAGETTQAVSQETADKMEAALVSGETVTLEVVYDSAITATDSEKALAQGAMADGEKVGAYFDLSILVKADGQQIGNLTQLSKPMTFQVVIPTELVKAGREYFIIRIHEGVAEKLATTRNEDGTLSFATDRFSTYALGYTDPASTSPDTGDSANPALWLAALGVSLVGIIALAVVLTRKPYRPKH